MSDYQISVTEGEARKIALDVAGQEPSRIYMIKLIETSLANIHGHIDGLVRLNSILNRQGFNVTVVEVLDKPVKAHRVEDVGADETIGAKIKRLRIAKHWSQTELATLLGWKQGTVSLFERERQKPSVESLTQLAEVFSLPLAEFVRAVDDTPMTQKKYLGRNHPVVDNRAAKVSKMPAVARRFREVDEDDDLPSSRELQRGKTYEPVSVTGPKVLDIITFRSICPEILCDAFEVTSEEHERIRNQQWADFGARWMHELLLALESEYKNASHPAFDAEHTLKEPKPLREKPPAQLTRSQLVAELRQHMLEQTWLTKEELVANFEFGEEEVDWLNANDHTKFNVTELRMFVTDVRGAIAERAIEVSQEAK